jgi:RecB family exonuclease
MGVIPLLVDERRLVAGLDSALAGVAAQGPREILTPAGLLERMTGLRVIGEAERRAVIRRIAATRDDTGIARAVSSAPSFAGRVAAAIDGFGERAPFEAIIEHYTTLLAFANVLDVPEALRLALAGERKSTTFTDLAIDTVLLADDERAFGWRRLYSEAAITVEALDLGPVTEIALDPTVIEGVIAILRFAASERDDDARLAIASPVSGVRNDDARALLIASAERATLFDTIDGGKVTLGETAREDASVFVRGMRAVVRAYSAPDASASSVLAAIGNAFVLGDDRAVTALVHVARAFDRARTLGPLWTARDFIAEITAELGRAQRPVLPFEEATPAPMVDDEPRVPVALRKLHFSASSLNAYAECARKWYFRYACAAVEDKGSSASFYGTAFHAALEEFHLRYPRIEAQPEMELASFLDGCIVSAFDRYRGRFDAPVEFELQRRRARRTGKKYFRWLMESARKAPFTVIGCEQQTELILDGHEFVGYIDRLDRDDATGGVTVIDYKTGSIAESAAEYRDDVAKFREFQLPFYYWARTAAGDRVTKLALIPLKDSLLDVAPIELEITISARPAPARKRDESTVGTISVAELERARAKMIEYASTLESSTIASYPAATDPEACRYCAYLDACRERPLAVGERFGR